MTDVLHIKHRPNKLEDVIGHASVISALSKMVKRKGSQTFLFFGPSGTGKTTLARITARAMGCLEKDVMEIDAATYTGIDSMRQIQEVLRYKPFGTGDKRAVIIDECHSLSKNSWQSLLKIVEQPPPHVVFFFCTTELDKVPATIKTRCAIFILKDVQDEQLGVLFDKVCEKEKIELPGDVGDLIIKEARGSPRQLLVNLAMCRDTKSKKEAGSLLRVALQSDPVLELCRFIMQGGSWAKAMGIVAKLADENPESVRIVVCNYIASVLKNEKTSERAAQILNVLEAFSTPYNPSERSAPLLLSIGRALFSGE